MNGDGEGLAAGMFHLISAHEVLPETWCFHPTYFALCGAQVASASLAGTRCPNECECEVAGTMACCPACLREALRLNRQAGVEAAARG
ncbi:MAG: hypothetical protein ACRDRU_12380 [Pseudonocardiaceae bacterium]